MRVIKDIEQGTKEWHDLRRCRITSTKLEEVMGTPAARLALIAELIAEEGTEQSKIIRPTPEMERGTAEEIFAIKRFEEKYGKKVEKVTMCISSEFDWLAVSPDALIPDENGKYTQSVEAKNPDSKTVIFYRMLRKNPQIKVPASKIPFIGIPADYKWQVVADFLVNDELEKLYFLIHDARFIEDTAKLDVIEINRENPELQVAMKEAREELIKFRDEWMTWREEVLPSWF